MIVSTSVILAAIELAAQGLPIILEALGRGEAPPTEIEIDDQHITTSAKDFLRDRSGS